MSNTAVRKQNGNLPAAPAVVTERDPYRLARDFLRWDPFREMMPYLTEPQAAFFAPAFEVKETKEGYVFRADLPGVKAADVEVHLTGNRLSIAGKREAEREQKEETFYAYERSFGQFCRNFTLPNGADGQHIKAELKEGVLTVQLPKLPEMQGRRVNVETPETTEPVRS